MDDMNNNKNGIDGSKQQESEIKIWKKPDSKRKRSYVYEVSSLGEDQSDADFWPEGAQTAEGRADGTADVTDKKPENQTDKETDSQKDSKSDDSDQARNTEAYTDSLSKEERQKQWRSRVINGTGDKSRQGGAAFSKKKAATILGVCLFFLILLGGVWFFNRMRPYKKVSVDWQVNAADSGYSAYVPLGDCILHYSQDGVSAMDLKGSVLWDQAFNMDVPVVAVRDGYALIYDLKGKSFYIVNAQGEIGSGKTEKKILKGDISASGVAALVLDDKKSNYINYFRKDGSRIDLEIKTLITGDGYPLDIAISPDGVELMTSYIYASQGRMLSEVVFRNFEVGKNEADRVVGAFKEFGEALVPDVMFFDNENGAAVTEASTVFFSTRNALAPELIETYTYSDKIRSVDTGKEYLAVILDEKQAGGNGSNGTGEEMDKKAEDQKETEALESKTTAKEFSYQLKVYNKNGKEAFNDTIDFPYDTVKVTDYGVLVFNKKHCVIYDRSGIKKFSGNLNMELDQLMQFEPRTLIARGNGALQKISLK